MEVILVIALIFSIVRGQAYKMSLKAVGIYMKKKDYIPPTESELKECSQMALKQLFRK